MSSRAERRFKVFCWFVIVGAILSGCHNASGEAEMGRSAIWGFIVGAIGGGIFAGLFSYFTWTIVD